MSTKLNAVEMTVKRYPNTVADYSEAAGYAAAIREVAQPIADQRDELLAELKAVEAIIVQPVRSGAEAELMASEVQALQHRISAAIAKCTPKP